MNSRYNKIQNKTQLITIDNEGIIIFNDNNLFPEWKDCISIFEANSFFKIIHSLNFPIKDDETYKAIPINTNTNDEKICDICFSSEGKELDIIIYDYSTIYKELNNILQENDELSVKLNNLQHYNDLLLNKQEFQNQFLANINHELSAPITSINGFVDLILSTDLDYEQEEIVKFIKNESEYMQSVFNDLLSISQMNSGDFKFNKSHFNIVEFFNSIINTHVKLIKGGDNPILFSNEIDPNIFPNVYGDKRRIHQIITTLLTNAIKYTDEGNIHFSVVRLKGKHNKQSLQISVKDTGYGILKKDQKRIFRAFSDVDASISGIGLGLNVAKNLIHLMGGSIDVKSERGVGSEFIVNLKISRSIKKDTEKREETMLKLPEGKKYRILVIENRLNTQYLIMKQLLKHGAFFIDVFSSAEEGISAIEGNSKYDLIVTDIKLPNMTGLEFISHIRKKYSDAFIKDIPIIGISGIPGFAIQNKAHNVGVNAFISKPFTQKILINKIIKVLTKNTAISI